MHKTSAMDPTTAKKHRRRQKSIRKRRVTTKRATVMQQHMDIELARMSQTSSKWDLLTRFLPNHRAMVHFFTDKVACLIDAIGHFLEDKESIHTLGALSRQASLRRTRLARNKAERLARRVHQTHQETKPPPTWSAMSRELELEQHRIEGSSSVSAREGERKRENVRTIGNIQRDKPDTYFAYPPEDCGKCGTATEVEPVDPGREIKGTRRYSHNEERSARQEGHYSREKEAPSVALFVGTLIDRVNAEND